MNVPIHSDPEVLEKLYERFTYLSGQPLKLRGAVGDAHHIGTIETEQLLGFVVADADETTPYQPDFPLLSRQENAILNHYVQVQLLEPWPRPLVDVVWGSRSVEMNLIEHVDLHMKPAGFAQLWYGGETGVIWEAFFQPATLWKAYDALLHRLWKLCEAYLAAKGVRYVHTYSRNPRFDEGWYAAFLDDRGYHADPSRDHLPGGSVAVVKHLGVCKGDEDV